MGVSTRGRYGLRFMLDLAAHHDRGAVTLKDVARRQEISEKYLWQGLGPLKAAGLVDATRGARGGYALAREPSSITVRDILQALEGEGFPFDGALESDIGRSDRAVTSELWMQLQEAAAAAMAAITLKDLADRLTARQSSASPMYMI